MNFSRQHLLAIVAIAALFASCKSKKEEQKGTSGPQMAKVDTYVIVPQQMSQTLEAAGTLMAEEEVQLRPEISGRIIQINFKEGAFVSKGQLLVKLFDADLKAQLNKLIQQKDLAKINEQRQSELLKIKGISQQDYDLTVNQLNNLAADIDLIKAQLQKTEIRAPFSGKLGLKSVSEGAYITMGTVIASLQQTSSLKVDFAVPEKYEAAIRNGQALSFMVDGRKEEFKANIYAIEPAVDLNTRSLKVRARINNTSNLLPGTFAKVKLDLEDIKDALVVPTQAIIPEARNKKVILVKGGKASFAIVETGVRTANGIQIEKGLNAGDTVVITGLMQIKPDMELKIKSVK